MATMCQLLEADIVIVDDLDPESLPSPQTGAWHVQNRWGLSVAEELSARLGGPTTLSLASMPHTM